MLSVFISTIVLIFGTDYHLKLGAMPFFFYLKENIKETGKKNEKEVKLQKIMYAIHQQFHHLPPSTQ